MTNRSSTKGQTTIDQTYGISSPCSTSGTRRVNLVTNPVISRELGKDQEVFTKSKTYQWSYVTQIFHNDQPSHGGDRKIYYLKTVLFTC